MLQIKMHGTLVFWENCVWLKDVKMVLKMFLFTKQHLTLLFVVLGTFPLHSSLKRDCLHDLINLY